MWKNRRRIVAFLASAAALLLPFLRVRGRSAVRFDLPTLSLHFFGAVVPIDGFYLVLPCALPLVALTLAVPSRGRITGMMTVQGEDGTPGEILFIAAGREFRITRKAAFP